MKDREFTDYYLSDRYNLYTDSTKDVYLRPAVDKFAEDMNTAFCIIEGGRILEEPFEMGPYYQFKDKELKLNIRHIILYMRRYLYNYIDMHETIINGNKSYYGTFNLTDFIKDKPTANHLNNHVKRLKAMSIYSVTTAAFMERFHMTVFTPEDPTYMTYGETEIRLFPFRDKVAWVKSKLSKRNKNNVSNGYDKDRDDNMFKDMYAKYKRFMTEYTVIYIKNPLTEFDISKEDCHNILLNFEGKQLDLNKAKSEFSPVFNYMNYL